MVSTKIMNIVATADLKQLVDIITAGTSTYFLHDPEIYGGRVVYYKSPEMVGKVTIFSSGKMISVGTRTIEGAFNNLKRAMEDLAEHNLAKLHTLEPKIQNIVGTVDFEKNRSWKHVLKTGCYL